MTDWAAIITAAGVALSALASVIAALRTQRIRAAVAEVAAKVETTNGMTAGLLAERAEGRAIAASVPPGEQTESERHYVRLSEVVEQPGQVGQIEGDGTAEGS